MEDAPQDIVELGGPWYTQILFQGPLILHKEGNRRDNGIPTQDYPSL